MRRGKAKTTGTATPPRVEKFLSVADAGAQLVFPGPYEIGVDARAYVIAIRRHLAEDKLRRVTVRNALALADALGRTLVLPSARCFCDKIWNNLNACARRARRRSAAVPRARWTTSTICRRGSRRVPVRRTARRDGRSGPAF